MRFRTVLIALLVIAAFQCPVSAEQTKERTTLAVMYFTNRGQGEEWDWLRKGLADLLITDLALSDRLILVEREKIQDVLKELKVSETGAVDKAIALKAAKAVMAEAALFGSYIVEGGNIEIEAHIIDLCTGGLRRVEWVKGKVDEIQKIEKELAEKLITNLDVKLTDDERERLRNLQTDSLDALAHFYHGLDAYDRGQYPKAFGKFRAAVSKDAEYAQARLWVAKMYISMGEVEHGLLAYQKALKELPEGPMTPRLLFHYAESLQDKAKDYEAAIRQYSKLLELLDLSHRSFDSFLEERLDHEETIERAKAEKTGNPQAESRAYQELTQWRNMRGIQFALHTKTLYNRGICYHKVGDLRRAVEDMYGAYALSPIMTSNEKHLVTHASNNLQLWYYDLANGPNQDYETPSWVYRFKSIDDSLVISPATERWLGNRLSYALWHGRFIEAPPGYVFDKFTIDAEISPLKDGESNPNLSLRGWHGKGRYKGDATVCNHDPKELKYTWSIDYTPDAKLLIVGRNRLRPDFKRIEIKGTFKKLRSEDIATEYAQIEMSLVPAWANAYVNGHRAVSNRARVLPGKTTFRVEAPGYPTKEFDLDATEEGLRLHVSLEDDWSPIKQIAVGLQRPSMVLDFRGMYRVVAQRRTEGVLNICQMTSTDALHWNEPVKLPVNSPANDWLPRLIQAENGVLILTWHSSREKDLKSVVCVSTSRDGVEWTDPVIIRPRKKTNEYVYCYSLWQSEDGILNLYTTDGMYQSEDTKSWMFVTDQKDGDWPVPFFKSKNHEFFIRYRLSKYWKVLNVGRSLALLKMRKGETRTYYKAPFRLDFPDQMNLVKLPDGSFFVIDVSSKDYQGGMALWTRDGETWTQPYRFHSLRINSTVVWDRGSRLVCVHEYIRFNSSSALGLVVTFCDLDKITGRPEQNPTPIRLIDTLKPKSMPGKTFSTAGIYRLFACKNRLFCIVGGYEDSSFSEINPTSREYTVHVKGNIGRHLDFPVVYSDSDGENLWVVTNEKGLLCFGLSDGSSKWYTKRNGLVSDNVKSVRCHEGKVYIGTLSGLNILDPKTGKIDTITKADGMPDNSIASIAFQGNIMWLGTIGNGAMMYDRDTMKWEHFPYNHDKIGKGGTDLCSEYIPAIFVNGHSVYFICYGIAEYNTLTKKWNLHLRGPSCIRAEQDGDLLWYASLMNGIFTFNMKTKEVRKHFIRTTPGTQHHSANFPITFTVLGDEVFVYRSKGILFAVPKEELLKNSFEYKLWIKGQPMIRQEKEKGGK